MNAQREAPPARAASEGGSGTKPVPHDTPSRDDMQGRSPSRSLDPANGRVRPEALERARNYPITDLWERLGYGETTPGRNVASPWRDDDHPSIQVGGAKNVAHDYGTGETWDPIALMQRHMGDDAPFAEIVAAVLECPVGDVLLTDAGGTRDAVEQLASVRGWKADALRRLGATAEGACVHFPMRDGGGACIGTRKRRGDGKAFKGEQKALTNKGGHGGVMSPWPIPPDGPVLILEGEADACAAVSAGWGAVCATPGASVSAGVAEALGAIVAGRDCVLVPHPDHAGETWRSRVTETLHRAGCTVRVAALPDGDLDDTLKASGASERAAALQRLVADASEGAPAAPPRSSEPTPLMRATAAPEPFPVDALMPHMRDIAELVQRGAQCPMDIAATTVLCTAAAAVQHQANLEVEGRTIPLVLFAVSVASSGDRKSAAERIALGPIKEWTRDSQPEYARAQLNYKADLRAYETAKRAIEAEGKRGRMDPADRRRMIRERLAALGPEPEPPRCPAIMIKDWTMEGVERHQANVWPSVALFTMEGGVAVGGWSMKAENLLYSLGKLSTLWDGAPSGRVRAGDGYEGAPGYRGSLHLGMQERVAEALLGNEMARNQGFLARTLVVWPESLEGTRLYDKFDPCDTDEYRRWRHMIRAALERELPWIDPERPSLGLKQRAVSLAPDAHTEYIAYYNHIESRLGPGGKYEIAAPFAAKLAEQALRMAAVQELIANPDTEIVSLEAVASGIEIANHYLVEYVRCIGVAEVDQDLRLAQEVLTWIRDKEGGEVTSSRLMQYGPYGVRSADTVTRIMSILMAHGHVYETGPRRWKAAGHE